MVPIVVGRYTRCWALQRFGCRLTGGRLPTCQGELRNQRPRRGVNGLCVRVFRCGHPWNGTDAAKLPTRRRQREVAVRRLNEEVEDDAGAVATYRRHANGQGLVSPRARVQPSAFVAPTAYVESGAQIDEDSWIGEGSWIDQGAMVGKRVFVGQNVHIGADSRVGNDARLGSDSRIGSGVRIAAGARIDRDLRVPDNSVVGLSSRARQSASPRQRLQGYSSQAGRQSQELEDAA